MKKNHIDENIKSIFNNKHDKIHPTFIPSDTLPGNHISDVVGTTINGSTISKRFVQNMIIQPQKKKINYDIAKNMKIESHIDKNETNYAKKRNDFITQVFYKRLHKSFMLNLSYLAKKDEDSYRFQIQQLEYQTKISDNIRNFYETSLCYRQQHLAKNTPLTKKRITNSTAGIGTKKRHKIEMCKANHGHIPMKLSERQKCGVYLTGLPVNTDKNDLEILLNKLFGVYGNVISVILYIDKLSGARKGDGLVLYHISDSEDWHVSNISVFLDMVSSQLNDTKLPCGSKIFVEAADLEYKIRNEKSFIYKPISRSYETGTQIKSYSSERKISRLVPRDINIDGSSEGDDLDVFFASLE